MTTDSETADNDTTASEDEWWECVYSAIEQLQLQRGCGRGECFTFACDCRKDAKSRVTRDLGVSYDG